MVFCNLECKSLGFEIKMLAGCSFTEILSHSWKKKIIIASATIYTYSVPVFCLR